MVLSVTVILDSATGLPVFGAGHVLLRPSPRSYPCHSLLYPKDVLASLDPEESALAPVGTPGVSDVPKGCPVVVLVEPNDRDNVVGMRAGTLVVENSRHPIMKGFGVDCGSNGACGQIASSHERWRKEFCSGT